MITKLCDLASVSAYERRLCEQSVSVSHSLVTALARLETFGKKKHI